MRGRPRPPLRSFTPQVCFHAQVLAHILPGSDDQPGGIVRRRHPAARSGLVERPWRRHRHRSRGGRRIGKSCQHEFAQPGREEGHAFGSEYLHQQGSEGSGVIVGPEGYILTNHHVIEAADEIELALADGRKAPARIVGTDPETDLAVLKVDIADLPAVTFGNPQTLSVGDMVLAIGNPFGVGQTVTMGIVSALGRSHLGISTFENFIQTDAAINPGNSGGALVDSAGNLIGINSAIYSRSGGSLGIGFAIPADLAKQVMQQIVGTGSVTRGWIGVEVQDISAELAESFRLSGTKGTLIAGVLRGGPADRAGVKPGDVLVAVESNPVVDSTNMLNLIAALEPGKQATLKVLRNRAEMLIEVNVGKRPKPSRRHGSE